MSSIITLNPATSKMTRPVMFYIHYNPNYTPFTEPQEQLKSAPNLTVTQNK